MRGNRTDTGRHSAGATAASHNRIPERFPWLRGAGDVEDDGSWWSNGHNVFVSDATRRR